MTSIAAGRGNGARTETGWRADPPPKPSAAMRARMKAEAAAETRRNEDWAKRHPTLAREERAIRKDRVAMLKRFSHKRNGTIETHAHASSVRQGALARLYMSEAISADQLAAAAEIAAVAQRIGADVNVRTASLETRVDRSPHGAAFFERLGAVRMEVAYSRWRAQLRGDAAPVLAMIVDDEAMTIVARRHGMHARRAKRILIAALDSWSACFADARRDIDAADLAAAQAGIL